MFSEFKNFALRGNVVDMAVGIIIGASFNGVVRSLVDDVIMPPIGLILGRVDFTELFINLSGEPVESMTEAQDIGAATLNYGLFINNVISLIIVAYVVFILMKWFVRLRERVEDLELTEKDKKPVAAKDKACPFCFNVIVAKATRCPYCTSQLQPVEGAPQAAGA